MPIWLYPVNKKFLEELRAGAQPSVSRRNAGDFTVVKKKGLSKFFEGTYADEYQQMLLAKLDEALPEELHWN